jgi:hypothetical protein
MIFTLAVPHTTVVVGEIVNLKATWVSTEVCWNNLVLLS